MTLGEGLTIAAIVVLLAVAAFFSASETALTAASRARLLLAERQGSRRAGTAALLVAMQDRMIGALLVGNNLVSIAASALATSLLVDAFGDRGVIYATVLMTMLVLVFAEVLPKTVAILRPERVAVAVAPAVRQFVRVFGPVTRAVNWIVRVLLLIVGMEATAAAMQSAREEIRGTVDLQHAEGALAKSERDRLGALLDLADLTVSDVMVHRTRMCALDADEPPARLVEAALAAPYTRLPLYRGDADNIIGVLHARDLWRALHGCADVAALDVAALAKPPWFVPDTTGLQDQLAAFLKAKRHFAVVVDEYGEVMGLVTLEDILEEIVGDIEDEHDVAVSGVAAQPDGSVLVEGSASIRDINRALDWGLPDEEATTAAGLLIHEAKCIPEVAQAFTFHGVRFEVAARERNRITVLRLTRRDGGES